jgi:hypothetical protein
MVPHNVVSSYGAVGARGWCYSVVGATLLLVPMDEFTALLVPAVL